MRTRTGVAKCAALIGFVVLVFVTYFLRGEVLVLSRIRFSSDNVRADEELAEMKATHPVRLKEYDAQMKQYDIEVEHYHKMLQLYSTDYDAYVKRVKDHYQPPEPPRKPERPRSPEITEKLARIDTAFRKRKFTYFDRTSGLNWVACAAAIMLVGGLVFLLMFDTDGKRIFYVILLALSFVFLIGPSFHTILSVLVGALGSPGM